MNDINWTGIILGFFTLLSSCGWFVNYRKYKHEANGLRKENKMKDMDLSRMYVDEFNKNIAEPLRQEVRELRSEVDQLRDAIQRIDRCPHRAQCPVLDGLQREPQDGDADPKPED